MNCICYNFSYFVVSVHAPRTEQVCTVGLEETQHVMRGCMCWGVYIWVLKLASRGSCGLSFIVLIILARVYRDRETCCVHHSSG